MPVIFGKFLNKKSGKLFVFSFHFITNYFSLSNKTIVKHINTLVVM